MPIVGAQINKIEGKRGELERELKIKSNVELLDVSKKDVSIGQDKQNMINFNYRFTVEYSENIAIILEGVIYYTSTDEKMIAIVKKWEKDKKLEHDMIVPILNHAMELGYIQAIGISDKLRLPPPIKMPKFVSKETSA